MTSTDSRYAEPAVRAATGVISGLAGLGIGQLAAAFFEPESAPLLAVASAVVDLSPTVVTRWAIDVFGSANKAFLLVVVVAVAAGLCGLAGVLSRRTAQAGTRVFVVLGAICALAAMTRPVATFYSAVPSVLATITAGAVLHALVRRRRLAGDSHGAEHDLARRSFLRLGGAVALAGAAGIALGQWAIVAAQRAATILLPKPSIALPALPEGLESQIDGIARFRTPVSDFYRVDTALTIPSIKPDDWRLHVDGDVDNPLTLTVDDLFDLEVIERDITLTCVSNPLGGPLVGAARWLGVRTSDVLAMAGVRPGVDQILSTDVDGMTISTPVQALTDGRGAMLAFAMNGEQLPRQHGFPVRLVTPGLYGFVGSTKWVTRLTATTYAQQSAYWTDRGWVTDGTVHTGSRIDVPRNESSVAAGDRTYIGGVAWAQGRGVAKVEVRIDSEPWRQAELGPDAGVDYWRQWYLEWTPSTGTHTISVRATDETGEVQTSQRADPYPSGATGWHTVIVTAD